MRIIQLVVVVLVLAAGAAWTGIYNVSARVPHWTVTREAIELVRDRSIVVQSSRVKIPPIDVAKLSVKGAATYRELCNGCHGGPGVRAEPFAQGLYPDPADLLSGLTQKEWKDHQLYWIIDNGIKMTAMPSFDAVTNEQERLEIVAFLRRLPGMTPEEYKSLTAIQGGQ